DWARQPDLGISCAGVALSDSDQIKLWSGKPRLSREDARALVHELSDLAGAGYSIVTWNGCGFDFRVLAELSGLLEEASQLALQHIDLMLMVTFTKGWFLSLQKALEGAALPGKLKTVQLSDGTQISDMDGARAPALWAAGEYDAVLTYLKQDVLQELKLAQAILREGRIRWISNAGKPQHVQFDRLLTVNECFDIPEPDTSWMTDPPSRNRFVDWMSSE
ncbi:MAG: ribonuclease H-like domain-containing protein, partial [Anaerolineales bacterium]|nr:ribonuclease H-like domain-containing protein [Anaerolineales bacterium]